MSAKKIGILGSGAVAKSLAVGFQKYGHEVIMGTRDDSKLKDFLAKEGKNIRTASFAEAAKAGEMLVLAVKGTAAKKVLDLCGIENLSDKIVIDTTNPIAEAPPDNGVIPFFTGPNKSLMEELQQLAPEAKFVKCFNSIGNAFMVNPDFGGIKPSMFICGNDESAKKEVVAILDKFGWETEDMGGAQGARAIEPLAMLWCIPGILRGDWSIGFKLLRK